MGWFGSDDDNSDADRSNQLIQKQIHDNEAALEEKRQSLFQSRLSIEKASGGLNWDATPISPAGGSRSSQVNPTFNSIIDAGVTDLVDNFVNKRR